MNSNDIIILTDYDDPQLELDLSNHDDVTSASDITINLGDYGAACETITMSSSTIDTITLPTTYTVGYGGTGISYTGIGGGGGSTSYTTSSPYQWTTPSSTFTISGNGSNDSSVKIAGDNPILSTDQGSVNVNDLIEVVNAMKQMIVEMARDDELPEKYHWVKDIAHDWMIKALKGPETKDDENN